MSSITRPRRSARPGSGSRSRYQNVPPEARPPKTIHIDPQWAVFIGGYRDFDSASRDLPKVKQLPEPPQADHLDFLDQDTKQLYHLNTYAQCMATCNPMVPMQKRDPNPPDPSWKNLNDGRPYNLLTKCGKPWTLVVAQFQGAGVIQPARPRASSSTRSASAASPATCWKPAPPRRKRSPGCCARASSRR